MWFNIVYDLCPLKAFSFVGAKGTLQKKVGTLGINIIVTQKQSKASVFRKSSTACFIRERAINRDAS